MPLDPDDAGDLTGTLAGRLRRSLTEGEHVDRRAVLGGLFLAVGVGAILQVLVELAGLVRDDGGRVGSATNVLAFLAGLVVMYATDLLVTL